MTEQCPPLIAYSHRLVAKEGIGLRLLLNQQLFADGRT